MKRKLIVWLLLSICLPVLSQVAFAAEKMLKPVRFEAKWGFINKTGQLVIEQKYERVGNFSEGLAVVRYGGKEGFISPRGIPAIPVQFAWADDFEEGLARVNIGGKVENLDSEPMGGTWGFIDKTGKFVIQPKYVWVSNFSEGLARARVQGKNEEFVYIDKQGKPAFPHRFKECTDFHEGYAWVKVGETAYAALDKKGNINPVQRMELPGHFSEGLAGVVINNADGFIDREMKVTVSPRYDQVMDFSQGLAGVQLDNKWGFIDKKGNIVIQPKYFDVSFFVEDYAAFSLQDADGTNRYGFINKNGQVVIQPIYNQAYDFSEGLSAVHWAEKGWGFIDKRGTMVIPAQFQSVRSFSGGLAAVSTYEGWGYADEKGKTVIKPQYDEAGEFDKNGLARVRINYKIGYIDRTGRQVIPIRLFAASEFHNGQLVGIVTDDWSPAGIVLYNEKGTLIKSFEDFLKVGSQKNTLLLKDGLYSVASMAGLKLRKEPKIDGTRICVIPRGEQVKVLEKTPLAFTVEGIAGHWARVQYGETEGYVFDGLLTKLPLPAPMDAEMDFVSYMEQLMGKYNGTIYDLSEGEYLSIEESDTGVLRVMRGYDGTDSVYSSYFIPGISVEEAFLLVKAYFGLEKVKLVDGKEVKTGTSFSKIDFPTGSKRLEVDFSTEDGDGSLVIEQSAQGYIRIDLF